MALAASSLSAHGPQPAPPQDPPRELSFEEYATRAAFLLSLAKFTEWPEGLLPPGEPLAIGVVGESPLGRALDDLAKAPWLGRKVVVRRFRRAADVQACHILYFPSAEEESLPPMQARLAAQGVLTVGETSFFLGYGGALQLFKQDGRLRFILNRWVLDQSHLRVAAQVQRLAKQVIDRPAP